MSDNFVTGTPGVKSTRTATPLRIIAGGTEALLAGGKIIDGSESRDPGNTGNVDILRTGLLMGKRTANSLYAPSIIGTLGDAYDGAATEMNVLNTPEATEIVRRQGTTGTFKLTGPPSAAGTVRTETVEYSAVGEGTGGDEVQTFTPDAAASAGSYRILLQKPDGTTVYTAALDWDSTLTECNAAITLALGAVAGWVASSSGSAAPFSAGPIALVLTASGPGYLKTDFAMCEIEITSLTGVATMTSVQTTRGIPIAGTITCTALGAGANEVHTITFNDDLTAGELATTYYTHDGFPITVSVTWHTNIATTISDWNTEATEAATVWAGTASVGAVMTGDAGDLVLTFSGVGFAGLAPSAISSADIDGSTGPENVTVAQTTAAVTASANDFIAGSFIQPTDGSEQIMSLINDGSGIAVTDRDGNDVDVDYAELIVGGQIDFSAIVNAPTDTSLIAYVEAELREHGLGYTFDNEF